MQSKMFYARCGAKCVTRSGNNSKSQRFYIREKTNLSKQRKIWRRKNMKNFISYIKNEEGISTVEVLVIIAVLVAAALLFKERLIAFVNTYFDKLNTKTGGLF